MVRFMTPHEKEDKTANDFDLSRARVHHLHTRCVLPSRKKRLTMKEFRREVLHPTWKREPTQKELRGGGGVTLANNSCRYLNLFANRLIAEHVECLELHI